MKARPATGQFCAARPPSQIATPTGVNLSRSHDPAVVGFNSVETAHLAEVPVFLINSTGKRSSIDFPKLLFR